MSDPQIKQLKQGMPPPTKGPPPYEPFWFKPGCAWFLIVGSSVQSMQAKYHNDYSYLIIFLVGSAWLSLIYFRNQLLKAREKSDATVERKPDSSETRIVTIHSSQNEDFQHKIPSLPQHLVIEGVADNRATMLNKLRTSPLDAGLHYEYGIQCVQSRDKSSAL